MMASGTPHEEQQMEPCTPQRLDELESRLETLTDIPQELHQTSLVCLKPETLEQLVLYLDNHHDIPSEKNRFKDYRGLAELIGLDTKYINHLTKSSDTKKTKVVIERWRVLNTRAQPVLGNLRKFIADEEEGIDRPDVITDLAGVIAKDAIRWERSKTQARTPAQQAVDTSWQLTIDDVASGRVTYYSCCLAYADEDEAVAQQIAGLFRKACPSVSFFLPQFDLLHGHYECDATAEVIDSRCGGKVLFLISPYFANSDMCKFVANFSKTMDVAAKNGNLIPVFLTNDTWPIHRVLIGISGLKWYEKSKRKMMLTKLFRVILSRQLSKNQDMEEHLKKLAEIMNDNPKHYLSSPYDQTDDKEDKAINNLDKSGNLTDDLINNAGKIVNPKNGISNLGKPETDSDQGNEERTPKQTAPLDRKNVLPKDANADNTNKINNLSAMSDKDVARKDNSLLTSIRKMFSKK